jgi:glycosyltransferase involved in cell wall biosynthesis
MKILFIAKGNYNGNVSPIIMNQCESIRQLGFNVTYFPVSGHGIKGYYLAYKSLKKYLKQNDVHILHAHFGFCGMISLFAKSDQKLIVSFMGDDLLGSIFKGPSYSLISLFYSYINRILARYFYDYTIVKSYNLACKLLNKTKFEIIPNGVNISEFYPIEKEVARTRLNWDMDSKYVIFVSDPKRKEKNFKLAEETVSYLNNPNIKLRTLYKVPNSDLVYYYNATDCLLLTSFHEGSPNVIKEAMACNTPIVAVNVGDIERVTGQIAGCYICNHNPEELSKGVEKAIVYGATNGKKRITDLELDSVNIAKRIQSIYLKLV